MEEAAVDEVACDADDDFLAEVCLAAEVAARLAGAAASAAGRFFNL